MLFWSTIHATNNSTTLIAIALTPTASLVPIYRDLKYDGGLFCSLYRDKNPPIEELYPPDTRVECIDPTSHMLLAGTIMDIPISDTSPASDTSTSSPLYTILFDNGTSASIPL